MVEPQMSWMVKYGEKQDKIEDKWIEFSSIIRIILPKNVSSSHILSWYMQRERERKAQQYVYFPGDEMLKNFMTTAKKGPNKSKACHECWMSLMKQN